MFTFRFETYIMPAVERYSYHFLIVISERIQTLAAAATVAEGHLHDGSGSSGERLTKCIRTVTAVTAAVAALTTRQPKMAGVDTRLTRTTRALICSRTRRVAVHMSPRRPGCRAGELTAQLHQSPGKSNIVKVHKDIVLGTYFIFF